MLRNPLELLQSRRVIRLREDRADDRGHCPPRAVRDGEEQVPLTAKVGGPHVHVEHPAFALARDADGNHGRLAGDAAVDPHLVRRRIEQLVAVLAGQWLNPERRDGGIELSANARDLRFDREERRREAFQELLRKVGEYLRR
jgi:hypothetical protein